MTRTLRPVLGDQLSRGLASLRDLDPECDVVLIAEVMGEATYVRHHKKKIAFLFSAMRHFAAELEAEGIAVDYIRLDEPSNSGTLTGEIVRAAARHGADRVIATHPGEWRVLQDMEGWGEATDLTVEIRQDDRFLASTDRFKAFAEGRRALRMEHFYREMRREHRILMDGDQPVGERWNFDADNRKRLPDDLTPPEVLKVEPDPITAEVLDLVERSFPDHFGSLRPFWFAVTAADAEAAFEDFVTRRLPSFGDYQDAMKVGEPTVFHAVIGLYLNAGLIDPRALCRRVERAYRDGDVPLNAAEGFIRQILGWREYIRGIYWLKMPGYGGENVLEARRPLPDFWWTGDTDMRCLAEAIGQTRDEAYAHHIQRLMVLGNFALIAGIDPAEVQDWFLCVYADAYEWVEMPNVVGMALYADGGVLASKPYAASGKYIDRMSNYCRTCRYDVKAVEGEGACPFNALYWDFLARNRERLANNQRLSMVMKNLDRMDAQKLDRLRGRARKLLDDLAPAPATPVKGGCDEAA